MTIGRKPVTKKLGIDSWIFDKRIIPSKNQGVSVIEDIKEGCGMLLEHLVYTQGVKPTNEDKQIGSSNDSNST